MRRVFAVLGIAVFAGCASPDAEGLNVYADTGLAEATAFELRMSGGVLLTVTGDEDVARLAAPLNTELPPGTAGDCSDGIGLLFFTPAGAVELTYCEADGTLGGDALDGVHVPVPDRFVDVITDWTARAVPPAP